MKILMVGYETHVINQHGRVVAKFAGCDRESLAKKFIRDNS